MCPALCLALDTHFSMEPLYPYWNYDYPHFIYVEAEAQIWNNPGSHSGRAMTQTQAIWF